jgi:hypothetical protein
MTETLELLPNEEDVARPLFDTQEEYTQFREKFMQEVIPQLEKWQEARRRSEEEARQRLLR